MNFSATHLAFFYSILIIGLVLSGIFFLDLIFSLSANWTNIFIFISFAFITSFLTLRILLYKHIHNRIRLIYKTIKNRKTGKSADNKARDYNMDLIGLVDQDMKKWADEQDKEMEKLIAMSNYRKEFIGNVAHELKTPIFNIQGYTLTLIEGGLYDENINEKYLKKIEKNITRMINLVNDLDSITKLESGQLMIKLKDFDPVELCNEVIDSLEEVIKEKKINIKIVNHYEGVKRVKADRELVSHIFSNLFINAINYNKLGGKVKAEFFLMDENMLIEITDNGVGIPEEDLPRVFERFYRVDKSRSLNSGGSGLGLAIVKHIVDAHKQTLNVRSTVGVGTTIAFTLSRSG